MPKTERDEILIKYAENLEPKTAGSWYDFMDEITTDVVITLGGAAVLQGLAAAGIAGPVLTSLLAIGGGPIGIALGLAASVGMAIYSMSQVTYQSLDDLISRLDALDPTEMNESRVAGWIQTLNEYKVAISNPPTTTDPKVRAAGNKKQLDAMTALNKYLVVLQRDFTQIKTSGGFTDMLFDVGQAEAAIEGTIKKMQQGLARVKQEADKSAREFIAKAGEQSGKNYPEIARAIKTKWDQVTTQTGGKAPELETPQEKGGWDLASKILENKASMKDFESNVSNMVMLNNLLDMALKSKASYTPPISKRALLLGDGRRVTLRGIIEKGQEGVPSKTQKKGPNRSSNLTRAIQVLINRVTSKYMPSVSKIKEDGIYGPETAGVLSKILDASPTMKKQVSFDESQHRDIRKDPRKLSVIYNTLRQVPVQAPGEKGVVEKSTKQDSGEPRDIRESWNKRDADPYEIDMHLRRMMVKHRGEHLSAYKFLRYYAGLDTPEQMAKMVYDAFATKRGGLPPPSQWTGDGAYFVDFVVKRFPEARGRHSIF